MKLLLAEKASLGQVLHDEKTRIDACLADLERAGESIESFENFCSVLANARGISQALQQPSESATGQPRLSSAVE